MFGIIVSGHGNFASGLEKTAELVLGKQDNLEFIDFSEGMGLTDIHKEFDEKIKKLSSTDGILVLTDLVGGTPFSTGVLYKEKFPSIEVISGCNFPMLITALDVREDESLKDSLDEIIEAAKDGIQLFKLDDSNDSEDDDFEYEDGI